MNLNTILETMNGTGLAELHQALDKARLSADNSNTVAFVQMITAVEEAGIANCGKAEFTQHVWEVVNRSNTT